MGNQHRGDIPLGADRNVMVFLKETGDHLTGKTSATLTITASKNGGAFASVTPTVTERGNGWYNLALTAADHVDTAGDLCLHITATGADPEDVSFNVDNTASVVIAGVPQVGSIADAVWDEETAGHDVASTWGKLLSDDVTSGASYRAAIWHNTIWSLAVDMFRVADWELDTLVASFSGTFETAGYINVYMVYCDSADPSAYTRQLLGHLDDTNTWALDFTGYIYWDYANYVEFECSGTSAGEITLTVNGRPEYGGILGKEFKLNLVDTTSATGSQFFYQDGTTVSYNALTESVTNRRIADSAAAADAVWDELRAGHTTADTFGEGVASVQGDVTGDVNGNVDGKVLGGGGGVITAIGAQVAESGGAQVLAQIAGAAALIGCEGWDGSQSSPLTPSFTGTVGGGVTITLTAVDIMSGNNNQTLGTYDGTTFTKDAGWVSAVGSETYLKIEADGQVDAGVMTLVIKTQYLGSTLTIDFNVPDITGGSYLVTKDGELAYFMGGSPVPHTLSNSLIGDVWDELLTDHTQTGSFGERVTALAREATLFAQLDRGTIQSNIALTSTSGISMYAKDCKTITFNLGTDWDLTGKKAVLTVTASLSSGSPIISGNCTVDDAANGVCHYVTNSSETATVGNYFYDLVVMNLDDSSPVTAAAGEFSILDHANK